MLKYVRTVVLLLSLTTLLGCSTAQNNLGAPTFGADGSAQLFEKMGSHTFAITTSSSEAQAYFDQGLSWLQAFNNDESVRSFTKATELDPECAMAWWGVSYAQGPSYNHSEMSEARNVAAWDALQNALAQLDNESPIEHALIEALTHRYAKPAPKNRKHLEQSYADALAKVWEAYPDNCCVGTFYAEALMVRRPWKLYTIDSQPEPETPKIVAVLERVFDINPYDPGANHLYIHAVEPSTNPDLAVAAADRLSDLIPGAGHLNHMPSHIYVQTGMWERSIEQNTKAREADAAYRATSPEQGIQHGYMAHNSHMLAFSAMMIGREAEAMKAARAMWTDIPADVLPKVGPFFDAWMCSIYDVQKRFGRWDDLLAEPAPPEYMPLTTAVCLAHRAVAHAAKKDFVSAEREYDDFRNAMNQLSDEPRWQSREVALRFLSVSDKFVAGEIELQKGNWDEAAKLLEEAAVIEDSLGYDEPPVWLQPVRHALGAVYMKSGKFADAERVYRKDLSKWRDNGWSLFGLARALQEQGKTEEALAVQAEYERVWLRADEPTTTSCKCIPAT